MTRKTMVILLLLFMVVLLIPTVSSALPIASDGAHGYDTSFAGLYKWFHSPDRWWN